MGKKQTRRSISVRGTTYEKLRSYCAGASLSMSDFVEQRIAEFFAAQGNNKAPVRAVAVAAAPARVAVARPQAAPAPERPLPARSAVSVKLPTAALRTSAPTKSTVGRPAPTPASQIVKARSAGGERGDYRAIRF